MIQKRLDLLKPYFKGIKVAENYKIAEFNLKKSWVIQDDEDIEVQQKEIKENNNFLYNMFYSDNKSFDEILDFVEESIINYNLEIEQKEALLRAKVEELKRVFENKSLDELNNLKFTTEENTLKLNGTKIGTNGYGVVNNNEQKIESNGVTEELSANSESK